MTDQEDPVLDPTHLPVGTQRALLALHASQAELGGPCWVAQSTVPHVPDGQARNGVQGPLRARISVAAGRSLVRRGMACWVPMTDRQLTITDYGKRMASLLAHPAQGTRS